MRYIQIVTLLVCLANAHTMGYSLRGHTSTNRQLFRAASSRRQNKNTLKNALKMDAFGYCASCKRVHAIPTTPEALNAAATLVHDLETSGRIDFDASPQGNPGSNNNNNNNKEDVSNDEEHLREYNSRLSIQSLVETRGKMLGVLVCSDPRATARADHDASGSGASTNLVVLKAFSGKLNGHWNVPGWVPSLYATALYGGSPEDIPHFAALQQEVADAMALETQLNDELIEGKGDDASKFQGAMVAAKLQRQALSREALSVLREHQVITNFRGVTRTLAQVHLAGEAKVPVGTGDCCATKLLAAAQVSGLLPLGIAEFYFGKRARLKTRVEEGTWYDACAPRCQQVLGFMLCGLEEEGDVA